MLESHFDEAFWKAAIKPLRVLSRYVDTGVIRTPSFQEIMRVARVGNRVLVVVFYRR